MIESPRGVSRRRFLELGSLGLAATLGGAEVGFAEVQSLPGIRHVQLNFPTLPPAWDGLTIVQVSDVHAGPFMPASRMRAIRDLITRIPADLILFTGDQMDRRPSDASRFVKGFSGIEAPLGVYGILGNHDHYIDPRISVQALTETGIRPLVNEATVLERGGERLVLIGVEDISVRDGRASDFSLVARYPGAFRICLCHQPRAWRRALNAGAHLTLAGHTHGGQIAFPSRNVNVARIQTRYIAGPYRRDDQWLYVSRGIGVGAVPVRVGSPPEIDVITLNRRALAA
ncbi:MAG TPA: metallophosphoesterase [Acidobacteria bacterium]|nr:metallophosphoesterase [Acidobacteriota bacterium]